MGIASLRVYYIVFNAFIYHNISFFVLLLDFYYRLLAPNGGGAHVRIIPTKRGPGPPDPPNVVGATSKKRLTNSPTKKRGGGVDFG